MTQRFLNNISFGNILSSNLTSGNFNVSNFTSSNLVANNVNFGVNSFFSGVFNAANNVTSASNVTGFIFSSSNVTSFTANVNVIINATTTLYENFTLTGAFTSTGWTLISRSIGDNSGVVFSINSSGQVQYTSTNVSGYTSSTIRFSVNQNSLTGTFTSLSQPTSANTYVFDSINISSTSDTSLNISGGVNISKALMANSISTGSTQVGTTVYVRGQELKSSALSTTNALATRAVARWTTRTSAADNQWRSVTWAPELGIFCAVSQTGTGNRVMTSPDGITWTTRASAADNFWNFVTWAPELGLFCAVAASGTGNRVMTSSDGITWTTRATADNQWRSITWAPELGLFCAVAASGTGNRVMTSPDGITWTTRASAVDNGWYSVIWSPELYLFCAVAISGTGNRVMTSPDGITWTTRTSAADNSWYGVAWAPELGFFCAVAISGTGNRVMTSPDGITWTTRTSAADNSWYGVAWAPELGLFCAVGPDSGSGNRVMTSRDVGIYQPRKMHPKYTTGLSNIISTNITTSSLCVTSMGSSLIVGLTSELSPVSQIIQNSAGTLELGVAAGSGHYSFNALSGDAIIRSAAGKKLLLQSGSGNAGVIISTGGNVGIGTNPGLNTTGFERKLDVRGIGGVSITSWSTEFDPTPYGLLQVVANDTFINSGSRYISFIRLGTSVVQMWIDSGNAFILQNGGSGGVYIGAGGTSWNAYSDRTLKTAFEDIETPVEKICNIKGTYYKLLTDSETQQRRVGVIAQDVQEVLPEAVSMSGDGKLGVSYTDLIPLMIEAINKQHQEIDTLREFIQMKYPGEYVE